jgi:hypothetical protein
LPQFATHNLKIKTKPNLYFELYLKHKRGNTQLHGYPKKFRLLNLGNFIQPGIRIY